MTDWEIFIDGLKFQWVIHPQWNPDLFWGLLLGASGFCVIFLLCVLLSNHIIQPIDQYFKNDPKE